MSTSRSSITMFRTASRRPASSQLGASRTFIPARRWESSNSPVRSSQAPGQNQGSTQKVYEKDGTNSNKNLVYFSVGALGLGGLYAFFMGRPDKVVSKAEEHGHGPISDRARRYPDQK